MYLPYANIREIKLQIFAKSTHIKVRLIQASKFSDVHLFTPCYSWEEGDQNRCRMRHLLAAGSPELCAILSSLMTIRLKYGKKI